MKKRELKRIFASFLIASIALTGCNTGAEKTAEKPKEEVKEETTKKEEVAEVVTVDETNTAKHVLAYSNIKTELEKAKEGQAVDWDLVQKTYQDELQAGVNEISSEFDQAITAALEGGKAGQLDANIARQLFDKTTQSYFYQKQKALQKEAVAAFDEGKKEEGTLAFEQIKLLINDIFVPTATKRDDYYLLSGEGSLVENINSGLAAQEKAISEDNFDDFKVYLQLTDKSIYRSYYLASASYAEKIEAAVAEGKEELELQNMQAEAWGFYQAIAGSLSGGDEAASTKLNELFSLDKTAAASIKSEEVHALFTKAIIGKITGYYEKAPQALEANELVKAKVEALEGNMFLKALQIQMNKKLGEEKANEVLTHAEEWFKAIAENKKEEAKPHSDAVVAALGSL